MELANKKEQIERCIGGYDLSHLNVKRLMWFEKQLQRLNSADLSSDEKVRLKIELAEIVLRNQKNRKQQDSFKTT